MEYSFIKASPEHEDQIKYLYKKAKWVSEEDTNFTWLNYFIKNSFLFALIKTKDNKIIGMGRVITDSVSDAYIQDLFILEEYRGKGIGKKLVNYLIENIKSKGINWIALIAEPGSKVFYEKIGFKVMENHTPMKLG